jgi:hypothetical protein
MIETLKSAEQEEIGDDGLTVYQRVNTLSKDEWDVLRASAVSLSVAKRNEIEGASKC